MPNKNHPRSHRRWRLYEHEVVLNEDQRAAVSWYFSPSNTEGEPWPLNEPVSVGVASGQLVINGLYLDSGGEWCTFPEERVSDARIRTESATSHANALLDHDLSHRKS